MMSTRHRSVLSQEWIRWLSLAMLIAGLVAFFALGLKRYLTFQALAEHRQWLVETVARNRSTMVIAFIAVYVLAIALSVSGGTVLTITSGFLFGAVPGAIATIIGATIGSTVLFVVAKTTFERALPRASDERGCAPCGSHNPDVSAR